MNITHAEKMIRDDFVFKVSRDIFKLIERNCDMLTMEGRSYSADEQCIFTLSVFSASISTIFISLRRHGAGTDQLDKLLGLLTEGITKNLESMKKHERERGEYHD